MSNSRIILYYSKNCKHSQQILNTLSRNSHLLNKFDLVDIAVHKPPKYITAVPSLLIPKANQEADMLVGKSVFGWLNNVIQSGQQQNQQHQMQQQPHPSHQQMQQQPHPSHQQMQQQPHPSHQQMQQQPPTPPQQQGISDFDPCTMNGFSDNFSFLGNDNKSAPMDHNFSFLSSGNDKLINPNQFQNNNDQGGNKIKSEMEQRMEQLKQARDAEVPSAIQRC